MHESVFEFYNFSKYLLFILADLLFITICIFGCLQTRHKVGFSILVLSNALALVSVVFSCLLSLSDENYWILSYMPYRPFIWYTNAVCEFLSVLVGLLGFFILVLGLVRLKNGNSLAR